MGPELTANLREPAAEGRNLPTERERERTFGTDRYKQRRYLRIKARFLTPLVTPSQAETVTASQACCKDSTPDRIYQSRSRFHEIHHRRATLLDRVNNLTWSRVQRIQHLERSCRLISKFAEHMSGKGLFEPTKLYLRTERNKVSLTMSFYMSNVFKCMMIYALIDSCIRVLVGKICGFRAESKKTLKKPSCPKNSWSHRKVFGGVRKQEP